MTDTRFKELWADATHVNTTVAGKELRSYEAWQAHLREALLALVEEQALHRETSHAANLIAMPYLDCIHQNWTSADWIAARKKELGIE